MRCKECNVEIRCRTDVCPLCHKPLATTEAEKNALRRLPRAYARIGVRTRNATSPLNITYWIVSVNLLVICGLLNYFVANQYPWSAVVAGFLLYFYILIRGTILQYNNFCAKVVGQVIVLNALMIFLEILTKPKLYLYEYVLPLTDFVSMIMMAIYMLLNVKVAWKYILNIFFLAIVAWLPLAIALIDLTTTLGYPAIIVAVAGAITMLAIVIASPQLLWKETKKLFHQ